MWLMTSCPIIDILSVIFPFCLQHFPTISFLNEQDEWWLLLSLFTHEWWYVLRLWSSWWLQGCSQQPQCTCEGKSLFKSFPWSNMPWQPHLPGCNYAWQAFTPSPQYFPQPPTYELPTSPPGTTSPAYEVPAEPPHFMPFPMHPPSYDSLDLPPP